MKDEDRVEKIQLNLEESGVLCHLLTPLLTSPDKGPFDADMRPFKQRMVMLFEKLSAINDSLKS